MRILILSFLLLCVTSCTVTYVPKYSQTIINEVTANCRKADSVWTIIQTVPNKQFITYAPTFAGIGSSFASVLSQDSARNKPALLLSQARAAYDYWNKYENEFRLKGVLTSGESLNYKNYTSAFCQSLLVSEIHLNK